MVWRPFYFARLVVDPTNPDRVFKPDGGLIVSEDGGRSFASGGRAHGDWHDVWIDPNNPKHVVGGDDGGLWIATTAATAGGRRKPADLAVLPRERRRPGPVPGLRRAPGQQLGRRLRVPGRHHQRPLGEPLRRRRLLDVRRPHRPRRRLRRVAGRQPRPRQPQRTSAARDIQPKARLRREAPLQLEHADPPLAERRRARSTSARSSCSARATAATPGSASRPTSRPTTRRSRSRRSRAASPSTTPPPRCTRRSTRSASRRGAQGRSGWAPTTATCS